MASIYQLKPAFQNLLRPGVRAAVRAGIRPNHLTIAAMLGSIAVGAALPWGRRNPHLLLLLPVWLFIRMALNAMDGLAAREHGMQTRLGAVLNELGDVLADVGLYLPLGIFLPAALWPVVAFTLGAALTEFCGVLGQALGAARRYEGPMGKSDRAFAVGALALLGAVLPPVLRLWPACFALLAALALVTCVQRLRAALREPAGCAT